MKRVPSWIMWSVILERKLELIPKEGAVSHVTSGENIFWKVSKFHEDLGWDRAPWVWGTESWPYWRVSYQGRCQILVRSWLFLWVPLKNFCWNVTGIVTVLRDGTLKRWTGHGSASVLMPSSPEWVPERRNEPHFLPWTLCLLLQHTEKALPNANPMLSSS